VYFLPSIIEDVFVPQFTQLNLSPTIGVQSIKKCGITYRPKTDKIKGYFWVLPIRNLCAITIADLQFSEEVKLRYAHPPFIAIGNYAPPLLEHFDVNTEVSYAAQCAKTENHLVGYIDKETYFNATMPSGGVFQCVSITMLPDYYEKFLPNYFSLTTSEIIKMIESIKEMSTLPEIEYLFAQICKANPSAQGGALYYESKILELISLIQMRHENASAFPDSEPLDEETIAMIHRVAKFIQKNCEQHITIETLSKIFYTNKNKLSYLFRMIYGVSIIDYFQKMRIEKAKNLLETTDLSIHEIANMVGYKNQGSFSERFKEETDLTPTEYKKILNL
jgi:AraC-like DNA-binding protein